MTLAKKNTGASRKIVATAYLSTDLPIYCPLCCQRMHVATTCRAAFPDGNERSVQVCQRHFPHSFFLARDPRLAAVAVDNVFAELLQELEIQRQPGQRPPLWRRTTRVQIVPTPAADLGQAALARRARWSAAGFLDRALELLAELVARSLNAGTGCKRDRRESEVA